MNTLAKDGCCSGNGDDSSSCCERNAVEESPSSNKPACSNDSCCNNNNVKQCCTDSSEPHASESCKDNVRCCNGTSTTGVPSCCKSNDENNSPVSNCCESRTSSPKIIPVARESCCNQQDEPKQHLTCLAVIRPDNTTVVVFDVKAVREPSVPTTPTTTSNCKRTNSASLLTEPEKTSMGCSRIVSTAMVNTVCGGELYLRERGASFACSRAQPGGM
eukprot:CCRYP_013605-RA/>CCRYP_013605-RA protein AED:0.44 eAED:0.70 QI:0/0/0/1/1/1/2/0/216